MKKAVTKRPSQADELSAQLSQPKIKVAPSLKDIEDKLILSLKDKKVHNRKLDVPIEIIHESTNQRREISKIEELALQIKEYGLKQPIGVQLLDNKVTVVYGHRRLSAYRYLYEKYGDEYKTISCIMQVYSHPEEERIISQAIENIGRENLNPLDRCLTVRDLKASIKSMKGTCSNEDVGKTLGLHRKSIELSIKIANWPYEAHTLVRENKDKFKTSTLFNIAKYSLSEQEILERINKTVSKSPPRKKLPIEPLSKEDSAKFKLLLESLKQSEEGEEELINLIYRQRKWLGSKRARTIMKEAITKLEEN